MPRKKKTEEVQVTCFDIEAEKKGKVEVWKAPEVKEPSFGTGWSGKNNKIQYYLREVKKNE